MQQRLSVTVDSDLIARIDQLTKNRSAAVEAGLRLWYKEQINNQLREYYQNQSPEEKEFVKEWAEFSQEQIEEILEREGL